MTARRIAGQWDQVPIRVYLIHSYRLLTEVVASTLENRPEISVLGSANDLAQAQADLATTAVDVVLIEAGFGRQVALGMTLELREKFPRLRILPLGLRSVRDILDFLEAGASGYILRQASVAELLRTIRGVCRGEPPCSPRVTASVCARIAELSRARQSRRCLRGVSLTPREAEILHLVASGLRNKEIARRLAVALPTVKNHVHNILDKLQVRGRREAIRRAYENGLLDPPPPVRSATVRR